MFVCILLCSGMSCCHAGLFVSFIISFSCVISVCCCLCNTVRERLVLVG